MAHSKDRYDWLEHVSGERVGEYLLDKYVGRGKVGFVYEAHQQDIPEIIRAVKLTPYTRQGWDNELKKVAKLTGIREVVQFHHYGTHQIRDQHRNSAPIQYTVWDYIAPGRNLRDYLKQSDSCPASFLFAIISTVLRVLHACQQRGIPRHGDLHPGNILIGRQDNSLLDAAFNPIEPVYVSDFGYGATGDSIRIKDDFAGLVDIAESIVEKVDWEASNTVDRHVLKGTLDVLRKASRETTESERIQPLTVLKTLSNVRANAGRMKPHAGLMQSTTTAADQSHGSVGQFQVSEMLGDDWTLWKHLFVASMPARSRILENDITCVITGPRGCGKTMVFRRLSEKLMLECGPLGSSAQNFAGFYVNANDVADAFAAFPTKPTPTDSGRLFCYAHLCLLSDVLGVEATLARRSDSHISGLPQLLDAWFGKEARGAPLVTNEEPLERYRTAVERLKREFLRTEGRLPFPAYDDFSQHSWMKTLIPQLRQACSWLGDRTVFVFVDDYTTPRVSSAMQRALNRMLFQRSSDFVFKIATEAATTFVPEDSSGKILQDGDDYRLIDMGEESLFMSEAERESFLDAVFKKRLERDPRVSDTCRDLAGLLGRSGISKTEFARRLRSDKDPSAKDTIATASSLRGAARRKVLYSGADVFTSLWSGDTRLMIQLMQDVVDAECSSSTTTCITQAISPDTQDRALRNRGGQWLDQQRRNHPTDPKVFDRLLAQQTETDPGFSLAGGSFGAHLKAIVEAFKNAARFELMGPVYEIKENGKTRQVPKMAFRIEITDEFRLGGLAVEIYRDLIRYGLFMRDARGKSVRGAIVPRLYLRRLLLPYCVLPLSKRDSVTMNCAWFSELLLRPDRFNSDWPGYRKTVEPPPRSDQMQMAFSGIVNSSTAAAPDIYDDLEHEND